MRKRYFNILVFLLSGFFVVSSTNGKELSNEQIRGTQGLKRVEQNPWEFPGQKVGAIVTRVSNKKYKNYYPFPDGILYGKSVYLSPGHGWYYTGTKWTTQRGLVNGIVEDFGNAETIDQFLIPCLMRAGANVIPVRETDLNTNMVVVDNDDLGNTPARGIYHESGSSDLFSTSAHAGFSYGTPPYATGFNPFEQGTNRLMSTSSEETGRFSFTFNVPADGYYNVYISYSAWSTRAPDAHYIIYHPGGATHFRVDQRHHGSTWVLLGKFWFMQGTNEQYGSVALLNDSNYAATDVQVSADAVRIGGGMGIIERGGSQSGYPRFEECCRYNSQFSGAPTSIYDTSSDDHNDDISCRSRMAAWVHEAGETAIYLSFHTNAGGGTGTSTYVYSPNGPDGSYTPGLGTPGSDELAEHIQTHVVNAARQYFDPNWTSRGLKSAYFGELNPSYHDNDVPAALVEALFHDSVSDTVYYREPYGRYVLGRALCHGIIEYFADSEGFTPVYPPEAPWGVKVINSGLGKVTVSWNPPINEPEAGDPPERYKVYLGVFATAFDEGTVVDDTEITFNNVVPGQILYFKVSSLNSGGESLSSPPVAVGVSESGSANVLILDGFTKLDSSMNIIEHLGSTDPVHRIILRKMYDFREGIKKHAPALIASSMAFDSIQMESYTSFPIDFSQYDLVDFISGRGYDEFPSEVWNSLSSYVEDGGILFVSGSNVSQSLNDGGAGSILPDILGVDSFTTTQGEINVSFTNEGLFSGIVAADINDGSVTGYYPDPVEEVTAGTNGTITTIYSSSHGAGIESSAGNGHAVTLSLPFESLESTGTRNEVISKIITKFNIVPPEPPENDGGVDGDTSDDSLEDSGNNDDCKPGYECHTETVYGCYCNSVASSQSKAPPIVILLMLFSLIIYRRKSFIR